MSGVLILAYFMSQVTVAVMPVVRVGLPVVVKVGLLMAVSMGLLMVVKVGLLMVFITLPFPGRQGSFPPGSSPGR
jgi:hypothetical protein